MTMVEYVKNDLIIPNDDLIIPKTGFKNDLIIPKDDLIIPNETKKYLSYVYLQTVVYGIYYC